MDGLTRLKSAETFEEALEAEIARARRYRSRLTLVGLAFELDTRRRVEVFYPFLKEAAVRVRNRIREMDLAFRIGDQIWIVVPETGVEGAGVLAHKLRSEIQQWHPPEGQEPVAVEVRTGVVAYPDDGEDRRALTDRLRDLLKPPG